ncbi:MAG: alpha/beta fold hydrolase [Bacteroidota bacterium]
MVLGQIFPRHFYKKAGYNVITFDLPDHDKNGKVKGMNKYAIGDYVNALKEEVAKLEESPIIVGHSMGGLIVQKYLESESCKQAILLAPAPPHGVWRTSLRFATKGYFYPAIAGLNLYGLVDTPQRSRHAFFGEELSEDELMEYNGQLCSESFLAFIGMLFPMVKINHHKEVPMLVIGGETDYIFTESDNLKTAQKYGAELIMVKDIAHDLMLDKGYEKVAGHMLDWLKQ